METKVNGYFLFDKDKFYEMWDDWYRSKGDPRRVKDIDLYRVTGKFFCLLWWELTLLMFMCLGCGVLGGVALLWWLMV